MFHIYEGFNLVETYHKMRHQRKYHPEDSSKRVIKIALVAIVTLLLWNMPTERVIAIFAFATLMWILEIVSSWATSIAIMVLMLLFCTDSGIAPMVNEEEVGKLLSYKGVMACFADPVIMLFIGGFVLAIAATKTGLDAQLAKVLLRPFGTKSEMVLLGFLLVTGLFSMFVSNTATAAMMLTFLTPVFRQLPPEGKGRIALAMSIPVAANLGGMGTPIGTPPNNIALKYLNDPEGLNMGLGFGQWMMFMFPLVVVLLFISWRLLLKFFPFSQKTVELKIDGGMQKGFQSKVVIFTFILWWFRPRLWSECFWFGCQCRREHSIRRVLATAHPDARWCYLLSAVELHLKLCYCSPADAYPGSSLRCYGRQTRSNWWHWYCIDWCSHRSIISHDSAYLYPTKCTGLRYWLCEAG